MKHYEIILKKMFKMVNETYTKEYVKKKDWYLKHEWTEKQESQFKKWFVNYLMKNKEARNEIMSVPVKDKKIIEKTFSWFNLDYGWKRKEDKSECKTCKGFGLWAIGDPSPMGELDSKDGLPSKKCPECKSGGRK